MEAPLIFVVDDSELVLSMATMALEENGYRVTSFPDWNMLDDGLQGSTPDMILLDVNMPEATGDFVLSYYREERGLHDVPLFLFSDINEDELRARAKECGADGYISKTKGVEHMVAVVGTCLALQRAILRAEREVG